MREAAVLIAAFLGSAAPAHAAECPPPPTGHFQRSRPGVFDLRYPHQPHRLVVRLKDPGSAAHVFHSLGVAAPGPEVLDVSLGLWALGVPLTFTDKDLAERAAELRASKRFEYVEPDYCVYPEQSPQPSPSPEDDQAKRWAIERIDAHLAWVEETSGSDSVKVAVIDSGIATTHPDLQPQLWENSCASTQPPQSCPDMVKQGVHGMSFIEGNPSIEDAQDHGTQISGIIGAVHGNSVCIRGVNERVSLMTLRVMSTGGTGESLIIKALQYAVAAKADVVNASWTTWEDPEGLKDALKAAGQAGIVVVTAAGRGSLERADLDGEGNESYPCSYKLANVICVASTDANDDLATQSSWGKGTVHLGAPGVNIYSTARNGACVDDSAISLAVPFVTGVAALIRAKCSSAPVDEVVSRIVDRGDRVPGLVGKTTSGRRLNALNALRCGCGAPCEGPWSSQPGPTPVASGPLTPR